MSDEGEAGMLRVMKRCADDRQDEGQDGIRES